MKSRTQPRVTWKVVVELDNGVSYREDISIKDIRTFISIAKKFNKKVIVKPNKKDTIINKYVFPYIYDTYPKDRIASIRVEKV